MVVQPCPPPFLTQNPYILRFHDVDKNSHLLVDGNPTGRSAMNFIKVHDMILYAFWIL
jgi:hypothetical protein